MGGLRKQSTPNFSRNEHFLPPDTQTYVCVSGGKKCLFFGKFGVLCFLETPVLRFALLSHYQRIIIDAEDTDVITLRLFVANKENELVGIRRKKSTYNCHKLCSPELVTIIVQLHVLTGCDATSGFFARGKKVIMTNVMKSLETVTFYLKDFGENLTMDKDVYKNIIMFIIRFVYIDKKSLYLAESRFLAWTKMKKKSTRRLPPDEDTLIGHIKRSNYVIYMNLNYDSSFINESPSNHGWIIQDNIYVPKRYHKPALPHTMISSLNRKKYHDNKSDEETAEEITDSIYQDISNESDADEINTDEELSEDDYDN